MKAVVYLGGNGGCGVPVQVFGLPGLKVVPLGQLACDAGGIGMHLPPLSAAVPVAQIMH